MALVFKIKLEDTLRRLVLSKCFDETSPVLTFQELEAKIRELFHILGSDPLLITYIDIDNDVVTMVDDEDVIDACVVQRLNPLRLDVKVVAQSVGVDDEKMPKAFAGPSAEPREYTGERSVETFLKGVFPEAAADAIKQFLTEYLQLLQPAVPAGVLLRDALQALDGFLKTLTGQVGSTTHAGRPRAAPASSERASFDPSKQSFGCQPRPQGTFVRSNKGSKGEEASTRIFHKGVQCDACGMTPIEGTRFNSMKKFNYDLCSSCFNEIGNETDYQRIDHPMHSHRIHYYQPPCVTRMALDGFLKALTGQGGSTTHAGQSRAAPASSESASFDPSRQSFGCQPHPQGTFVRSNKGSKGEASTRIFHKGVQCDGCEMTPIEGPRFKSMKKFNYDLCSSCFNGIGNETDYQRIDHPMHSHRNNYYQPPCATRMMQQPVGPPPLRSSFSRCPYSWKPVCPFRGYSENANAAGDHASRKLDARFVQDVTIFDGTELAPCTKFTKIWRLSNLGTLPWPQHTQLVHIGGDVLGSDEAVILELPEEGLPCGKDIEASVDLVAPERAGRYASHWCLMTPSGQRFGQRVWVLIQVVPKGEQSPQMLESVSGEEELKAKEESIPATSAIHSVAVQDSVFKAASTDETVEAVEAPNFCAADEQQAEHNISEVVSSELGDFSMLDKPAENDSGKLNLDWVDLSRLDSLESNREFVPKVQAIVVEKQSTDKSAVELPANVRMSLQATQLEKLESMGFTLRDLNIELLEKNNNDLQHTIDSLVSSAGWDSMLEDLQEMGFYDTQTNRHLLFKNEGNIKRVVKDLVEMEKQRFGGKGKDKA